MKNNPAKLSKNEINSCKIWSLLRFNEEFGKDVDWFSEKYKRSKNKRLKQENRDNVISELHNRFEEINSKHPFAGAALQWMFPMPKIIRKNGEEVTGHPLSWGPVIWPTKGDKIDVLAEWKEYVAGENLLTLKTDWHSANGGFKRDFMFQYRQLDSRPVNPITKNRSDSPSPHETDFFDSLDLASLINQGPNLTEEALSKVLHANDLKNNYRVLAIPRHIHTKTAVDGAFKPLIKLVKASLPAKASASLGTEIEWKDYLAVREIQENESIPTKTKAIQKLLQIRHPRIELNKARRMYEGDIINNCKAIEDKINSVYPRLLL
jgi:hypothetical protein